MSERMKRSPAPGVLAVAALSALLVACAAASSGARGAASDADPIDRVTATTSNKSFDATLKALEAAATERGYKIIAKVDHAAGARAAGLDLPPSTLVLFGDPKRGTPLIAAAPTLGLDLPLRALVFENADGKTAIAITDMRPLFGAHGAPEAAAKQLNATLKEIAEEAAR